MKHIIANLCLLLASTMGARADVLPYQNPNLSADERAADLLGRLTLEEKMKLTLHDSPAIERLGIPAFNWWSEALHGVGRNGIATIFPACIGMASSFDDDMIESVFTAVGDEARAKNTLARRNGNPGQYRGISFWTPNINVFRDPRWGRGQETYGEDPFMNARMGARVVRGLQGDGTNKYYKTLACAKHYAVHSGPEGTRHHFNITDLPERDLWETYMPAFKYLVQNAGVRQVMCAYQRFEGDPCCGSDQLLQKILRDRWGFDGVVVSDCGAIDDFYRKGHHEVVETKEQAAAMGVRAGTDVECGWNGPYSTIDKAVAEGLLDEATLDRSVLRVLRERFASGDFDADSLVSWRNIPMSVVAGAEHRRIALDAARKSIVLLKNNGILPLAKSAADLVVMGPNAADSVMQWSIYYGQPVHTVTALEGIRGKIGDVAYLRGCGITAANVDESRYGNLTTTDGQQGMEARFWNNVKAEGEPAAETTYKTAPTLSTGGNTVFAPGVALDHFTMQLRGKLKADADEQLHLRLRSDDVYQVIVDGDTLRRGWNSERHMIDVPLDVEAGRSYDIELLYTQFDEDAMFNFDVVCERPASVAETVAAAGDAGTVVFFGGISPELEREEARVTEPGFNNGDRTSIELPQVQRELLRALHDAGKRIVFVNCSGSAVALTPEAAYCDAIVQAWYPGQEGGHAVADVLFGDFNPQGKLPVTFYRDDSQLPAFDDYHMEGRTYRYIRTSPLYPFGHGLSYTTFAIGHPNYNDGRLSVEVSNTGSLAGTEVVQVYFRRPDDTQGPEKTLCAYKPVELQPGETRTVDIDIPATALEAWDASTGTMRTIPGAYQLLVGNSSADGSLRTLNIEI